MKKQKLLELFSKLIERLYSEKISDDLLDEILEDINECKKHIGEDKFFRELGLLINTAKKSKEERRENLRIAIISDLEKEFQRLKELN
jgi:hypothetical protein